MYLVLLLLGLLAAGAGLAAIGFGIPINESILGNTIIIAGSVGLSAGLLLIGLAVAVRRLDRIAEALAGRPTARVPRPEGETGPSRPVRGPNAARPGREDRELRPEPQFVPAGNETPDEVEEADAPLSPQARSPVADRPRREPPWRPILPTEMSTDWPAKSEMFDSLWPSGTRGTKPSEAAKSDTSPGTPASSREPRNDDKAKAGEAGRATASVLKSGIVDGMAYTLYADGSIEAQLPEGTVRFASIDELRDHLEKHS